MKVLIVDDEKTMREMAAHILRSSGYETDSAANGEEAMEKLGAGFDIILSDLDMPGALNGVQLAARVRRETSMDVLIMTGFPDLSTAIGAVRAGAYDYLVKPFSADTLRMAVDRCAAKRALSKELERERALRGELDRAYAELAEMQRVRALFGQFATPEVARLVLEHPEEFWRKGERREVTVLFADARGFTPYAGRVPPEEAVGALNGIFEVVVSAVQESGGVVNKFMGDGLMAVFGAPQDQPDHALAAAAAALRAREGLAAAGAQERPGVGFSLNTGDVLAGCLGAKDRAEYSVIGQAVNLAARMEKVAKVQEILVGPAAALRIQEAFELEPRGPSVFAGFSEPVELWALLGRRPAA